MQRRLLALLGLLALTLFAIAAARADDPKVDDPLQPFSRFVGGAWESEGDFKVHIVYEWGLNKKLLKIKSYLVGEKGPQLAYESNVYWHPEKKEVVFQSVSARGGLFDGVMTVKDKTYTSVFTSFEAGTATPFRQTIEFLDDDHVLWTVLGKKGAEWVPMIQMKEKRVKDAAAK
jgi:hypothetical protein